MSRGVVLTPERARLIKQLLTQGKKQTRVAMLTGVSQATVSKIKAGHLHGDVPWPSGATGEMPSIPGSVEGSGWSTSAQRFTAYPEILQQAIYKRVNEEREVAGLPLIPPASERYINFLEMPSDDREFEATLLSEAQSEEDKRMGTIMEEFDEIVEREQQEARGEELLAVVQAGIDNAEEEVKAEKAPPTYERYEWEELFAIASSNIHVAKAAISEDPVKKEAVAAAFWATRKTKDGWISGYITRSIGQFEEMFRRHPTLVEEIESKYKS